MLNLKDEFDQHASYTMCDQKCFCPKSTKEDLEEIKLNADGSGKAEEDEDNQNDLYKRKQTNVDETFDMASLRFDKNNSEVVNEYSKQINAIATSVVGASVKKGQTLGPEKILQLIFMIISMKLL